MYLYEDSTSLLLLKPTLYTLQVLQQLLLLILFLLPPPLHVIKSFSTFNVTTRCFTDSSGHFFYY